MSWEEEVCLKGEIIGLWSGRLLWTLLRIFSPSDLRSPRPEGTTSHLLNVMLSSFFFLLSLYSLFCSLVFKDRYTARCSFFIVQPVPCMHGERDTPETLVGGGQSWNHH